MLKLSHTILIVISGLIWFAIGAFLLSIGLNFLVESGNAPLGTFKFLDFLGKFIGGNEQAVLFLVVIGLMIGYFKGRFVLGKAARKGVDRIRAFENPAPITSLYSARYLILLGVMMGIGFSFRFFNLSHDIRGFIDVAIGAALLNGAMLYFRYASESPRTQE